jgi:gluconate 2-dehydrogenase subunit 3-like protein
MDDLSRRALLQAIAAALGVAALPSGWTGIVDAAVADEKFSFFNASEAADVEAVAAQIIPTDDTPGAREAGVIVFIDRALATFLSHLADDYRAGFADFQASFRKWRPGAGPFASLNSDQQIEFLKTVDRTPFFESTRLLTLLGMFTMPKYGGNRDGIGWKLLGFEHQASFQAPFGFYDRDYPGFAADSERTR